MGGREHHVSVRLADSFESTVPEVQMESAGCPLACDAGDDLVLNGTDRLHGLPGIFKVVRCRGCGLMRTDPRPTPQSMATYYPADYGPHRGPLVAAASSQSVSVPRRVLRAAGKLIQYNATRVPPVSPGRMLEIGCATGSFLQFMSAAGWEVEGIEASARAAELAGGHGFSVETSTLENADPERRSYDLIVGWMAIEHLHEPRIALQKLRGWIKPGGWLVFSVPNANSLEFRLFKHAWYALQLPTHLFHFTPRTLNLLLQANGWTIRRIFHQRVLSNLAGSAGYLLQDRRIFPRLARFLVDFPDRPGRQHQYVYPLALALSAFGQTGRMTVWAQPTT